MYLLENNLLFNYPGIVRRVPLPAFRFLLTICFDHLCEHRNCYQYQISLNNSQIYSIYPHLLSFESSTNPLILDFIGFQIEFYWNNLKWKIFAVSDSLRRTGLNLFAWPKVLAHSNIGTADNSRFIPGNEWRRKEVLDGCNREDFSCPSGLGVIFLTKSLRLDEFTF